jgi:hypothetical protein
MSAARNEAVLNDRSNFSKTIDFGTRMMRARKKLIKSTLARAGGGAGHDGPPRLVLDHLEARDLIARDIRKDKSATSDPIAFLFCGSEVIKTGVLLKVVNPFWKPPFFRKEGENWVECDKIIFGVNADVLKATSLHIQIKDEIDNSGKISPSDDNNFANLGGITFDLNAMREEKCTRKKLQWYDLNRMSGMPTVKGQVRFSLRYTGKLEEEKAKTTSVIAKKKHLGALLKPRKKKTDAMNEFQRRRMADAALREAAALKKAEAEQKKSLEAEEKRLELQLKLQEAIEEKKLLADQIEAMKEDHSTQLLTMAMNPEDSLENFFPEMNKQSSNLNLERQLSQSIARLKASHTRSTGMAELHAITQGLTQNDIGVVLSCLRRVKGDPDGSFQRACVKFIGVMACTAPSAMAPFLQEFVEEICDRITVANKVVHSTCIDSFGYLARNVLPLLNRGRIKPSFSPIIDPLGTIISQHGGNTLSTVAAHCLRGAFSIKIPARTTVQFKITGLSKSERDLTICKRIFRNSVPNLKLPQTMQLANNGCLMLEVPMDGAAAYYKKLLDASVRFPPGWSLVASPDAFEASIAAKTAVLASKVGTGGSVPGKPVTDNIMKHDSSKVREHIILLGGSGNQIFKKVLSILPATMAETRAALLDSLSALVDAASFGEAKRLRRLSNSISTVSPTMLQVCIDTLLEKNKTWNWKSRRSALLLLGKLARLHGLTNSSGQILRNLQIVDDEVDIVIILKCVRDCMQDRVNVVRECAANAMDEFSAAELIPEGFRSKFAPKNVTKRNQPKKVRSPRIPKSPLEDVGILAPEERTYNKSALPRPEKREFPTRYKSRAPKSFTGLDKEMPPLEKPIPAHALRSSCIRKLDQQQRNYLSRVTLACVKNQHLFLREMKRITKRGVFALVVPHLLLSDELEELEEKAIVELVRHTDHQVAESLLHVVGQMLTVCANSGHNKSNDMAAERLLLWTMILLNTCFWSVDEIVNGESRLWVSIKSSLRLLSGETSKYAARDSAAKAFAIVTNEMLLSSHMYIFGDEDD